MAKLKVCLLCVVDSFLPYPPCVPYVTASPDLNN